MLYIDSCKKYNSEKKLYKIFFNKEILGVFFCFLFIQISFGVLVANNINGSGQIYLHLLRTEKTHEVSN